MSWQAGLLRLFLRRTLKAKTTPEFSVDEAREMMARSTRWIPAPPIHVKSRAVAMNGVPGDRIESVAAERVVLYCHGGAYIVGSPASHRDLTWRLAQAAQATLYAIDYRLAPEHPYPAQVEDAVAAYDWLLEQGVAADRITLMGDSAGGGLVLCAALKIRDTGRPLPAAIVAMSPWTDLTLSGASMKTNDAADPMLSFAPLPNAVRHIMAGGDPREPYVSPLFGRFEGLPPTLILVGSTEILLDDSRRIAERMAQAGVQVTLEVWPDMPHVWPLFARFLPEGSRAVGRIGAFVRSHV